MAKYAGDHVQCIVTGKFGADLHHIYTQKAYPEFKDFKWNLLPVCHQIHQEIHTSSLRTCALKYTAINEWLKKNKWHFDMSMKKWWNQHAFELTQR